jgi:hypothetical protein
MQRGDKVRDRANLGGIILGILHDRARVLWNNGMIGWIRLKWLSIEQSK